MRMFSFWFPCSLKSLVQVVVLLLGALGPVMAVEEGLESLARAVSERYHHAFGYYLNCPHWEKGMAEPVPLPENGYYDRSSEMIRRQMRQQIINGFQTVSENYFPFDNTRYTLTESDGAFNGGGVYVVDGKRFIGNNGYNWSDSEPRINLSRISSVINELNSLSEVLQINRQDLVLDYHINSSAPTEAESDVLLRSHFDSAHAWRDLGHVFSHTVSNANPWYLGSASATSNNQIPAYSPLRGVYVGSISKMRFRFHGCLNGENKRKGTRMAVLPKLIPDSQT